MNLFYTPDIESDTYTLNETESKHCVRVLRMTVGDKIRLVDGKGYFYTATIADANPKRCKVAVEKKEFHEHMHAHYNIAIAPTKNNDRYEWFLEKATEIGVNAVYPVITTNSERKVIKKERLEKVIVSAMKQSLKATKPVLHDLENFKASIKQLSSYPQKYIAFCDEDESKDLFQTVFDPSQKTIIMIGPEGDFSKDEVTLAKQHGFKVVSLGESRLRTETAGIVACTLMNVM